MIFTSLSFPKGVRFLVLVLDTRWILAFFQSIGLKIPHITSATYREHLCKIQSWGEGSKMTHKKFLALSLVQVVDCGANFSPSRTLSADLVDFLVSQRHVENALT